jgi:c-di-GMP-binding flagellar brake protein YcgR
MDQVKEKRQDIRLPLDAEVEIHTPEHSVRAMVRDISLSGLFIRSAELLPIDTVCEVEVLLAADEQNANIKGRFRVVRQEEDARTGTRGMGFRFVALDE